MACHDDAQQQCDYSLVLSAKAPADVAHQTGCLSHGSQSNCQGATRHTVWV